MTLTSRVPLGTALGVLALLSAGCASVADQAPAAEEASRSETPTTAERLPSDAAFAELLAAFDVPGVALATLTDCEVDGVRTFGLADRAGSVPITDDTAFEAASLSKPVFAYLVLQLVDEGVIELDAPLSPFPYPRAADQEAYAKITPRTILTHRTGMPNWVGDSRDEDRTDPIPFESAPGEAYSYSGEAFEMLRAYAVAKTGQSLQELFVARLGELMPSSSFDGVLRGAAVPSRAYVSASGTGGGRDLYAEPHETGAAWGLVTTAGDYAAFVGRVCKGEGLSKRTLADMLRPQTPLPPGDLPGPAAYGLGWVVLQLGAETVAMHDGDNDEYKSFAAFLPETGEGYVILTNGRNGGDMIAAILEEEAPRH